MRTLTAMTLAVALVACGDSAAERAISRYEADGGSRSLLRDAAAKPVPLEQQAAELAAADQVNTAAYGRLQTGMSRAEVGQILGSAGETLAESMSGAGHIATVQWRGSNGGAVTLTFHNSQLVSKAQAGLR